jgi:hypothetical protein
MPESNDAPRGPPDMPILRPPGGRRKPKPLTEPSSRISTRIYKTERGIEFYEPVYPLLVDTRSDEAKATAELAQGGVVLH